MIILLSNRQIQMPVNPNLYPKNWKSIALSVKETAIAWSDSPSQSDVGLPKAIGDVNPKGYRSAYAAEKNAIVQVKNQKS